MRYLTTVLIIILILAAPWWVYIPALIMASLRIDFYLEAIPLGFLIDVLYGSALYDGTFMAYPFGLSLLVLTVCLLPFKSHIRLHV